MSVINDLSTDQRVHKHCTMLIELDYEVLLIGRALKSSVPLEDRAYKTHRMKLPFEKGPLFYATYNIGLFFHLLFRKTDLLFSNDLDTLIPNYLISRLKGKSLVYDSHEYFTEVPELVNRPFVQRFWKRLESWILPKLKHTVTVNASIASLYKKDFGIEMNVVRNIPKCGQSVIAKKSREELKLPIDKKLIILQGSGINIDRGAEEAVLAMKNVDAILLILGSGDVVDILKKMVANHDLESKVIFKARMPYQEMMAHTLVADLGLTLDKDTNINYRFSLPNKLFDYIHAGIPVLASDLVEVKRVVEEFDIGDIVDEVSPGAISTKMNEMLNSSKTETWKRNCQSAKTQLNWENESKVLKDVIAQIDG